MSTGGGTSLPRATSPRCSTRPRSRRRGLGDLRGPQRARRIPVCRLRVLGDRGRAPSDLPSSSAQLGLPAVGDPRDAARGRRGGRRAGVVLGLGLGEIVSRAGFSSDVAFLSGAFPIGDERVVTWRSVAIAAVAGLLAAAAGVLAPVRDVVVRRSVSSPPRRACPHADRRRDLRRAALAARRRDVPGRGDRARGRRAPRGDRRSPARSSWASSGAPAIVAGLVPHHRAAQRRRRTIAALGARPPAAARSTVEDPCVGDRHERRVAVFGAASLEGARQNLKAGLAEDVQGLAEASPVWMAPRGAGDVYGTATFDPNACRGSRAPLPGVGRSPRIAPGSSTSATAARGCSACRRARRRRCPTPDDGQGRAGERPRLCWAAAAPRSPRRSPTNLHVVSATV